MGLLILAGNLSLFLLRLKRVVGSAGSLLGQKDPVEGTGLHVLPLNEEKLVDPGRHCLTNGFLWDIFHVDRQPVAIAGQQVGVRRSVYGGLLVAGHSWGGSARAVLQALLRGAPQLVALGLRDASSVLPGLCSRRQGKLKVF